MLATCSRLVAIGPGWVSNPRPLLYKSDPLPLHYCTQSIRDIWYEMLFWTSRSWNVLMVEVTVLMMTSQRNWIFPAELSMVLPSDCVVEFYNFVSFCECNCQPIRYVWISAVNQMSLVLISRTLALQTVKLSGNGDWRLVPSSTRVWLLQNQLCNNLMFLLFHRVYHAMC